MAKLLFLFLLSAPCLALAAADLFKYRTTTNIGRLLEEDHHDDHEDHDHSHAELTNSFAWAGIFHFHEGEMYTLNLKVPGEGGNDIHDHDDHDAEDDHDDHEGHNHQRRLQETHTEDEHDDHETHDNHDDHDEHGDEHADEHTDEHADHDDHGDEVEANAHDEHADHDGHDDHSAHAGEEEEEYHFLMALVPVLMEGQEGIDEAMRLVNEMGEEDNFVVSVDPGDTITPSTDHAYEIFFVDVHSSATLNINITELMHDDVNATHHYVLFLPASPSRIEANNMHFLTDAEGEDVWPESQIVLQEESTTTASQASDTMDDVKKPWGTVIGATFLVNLVTLIGVIFVVPLLATAFQNNTLREALKQLTTSSNVDIHVGNRKRFEIFITAFACGALLATSVFLVIPEAILLVNSSGEGGGSDGGEGEDSHAGHDHRLLQEEDHEGHDHGDNTWVFGTCLMAGFLLPMALASLVPHHHHHHDDAAPVNKKESKQAMVPLEEVTRPDSSREKPKSIEDEVDVDAFIAEEEQSKSLKKHSHDAEKGGNGVYTQDTSSEEEEGVVCVVLKDGTIASKIEDEPEINAKLVTAVILGDALHNFADGIFIGVAFMICGNALGWSVLAGTIYHELAQEVSDFFLLTNRAHLPPLIALALNFASGLSVTLGGIVVLAMDVSNFAIGVILSISAGIYVHIAAKECMPTVDRLAVSIEERLLAFVSFAMGAIPIGLVLLNHQHCES